MYLKASRTALSTSRQHCPKSLTVQETGKHPRSSSVKWDGDPLSCLQTWWAQGFDFLEMKI